VFDDNGSVVIDGREIRNSESRAYGKIDLKRPLRCQAMWCTPSWDGAWHGKLVDITYRAGFEKEIPFDIPTSKSRFPYENMNKIDLAEAAIGQGKVLVSPLHMAMITSAIANEGVMMEPVLVKSITNSEGKRLKS